jgi:hypothetical integral membrane protein (TIGR02206 family)
MDIFSAGFDGEPFRPFSTVHIATLVTLLVLNLIVIISFRKIKSGCKRKVFRNIAAGFLLFNEGCYTVWTIFSGNWTPGYSLPLHLCDMAMFFSVIMLLTKNSSIYEITYFWGFGAGVQALLTPDLYPYSFPHFIYFNFFLAHGAIITAVFYMTFVEGFRPRIRSIPKTMIFTNIYMALIAVVNIITKGNYLFLCHKPNGASVMDMLGPWPWYIASLEVMGLVLVILLYLPWFAADLVSGAGKGTPKGIQQGKSLGT